MEIATIFKEESEKRTGSYPGRQKNNKIQRKSKKTKRSLKSATNMEIATIFKEECARRSVVYPERLKVQRMQQKSDKKSKRKKQPVGSFDP